MNSVVILLITSALLFCILFVLLVSALSAKHHRTRVRSDMKRIKSQVNRDIPDPDW